MISDFTIEKVADNNYKATMHFGKGLEGTLFTDQHFENLTLNDLREKVKECTTTELTDEDVQYLEEMPLVLFGY